MKTYKIHLIRHGMTDGNLKGQYIGVTDLPLNGQGIAELEQFKAQYGYPNVGAVFASPLLRCVQTANILYPQHSVVTVEDLRECDFGQWEGKTGQELGSDPVFAAWIAGGGRVAPPGGESGTELQARVCKAFEGVVVSLMKAGVTETAVIAHGGTIMGILAAFGLPRADFYDWMTPNGQGYSVRITPSLWMTGQVMEVFARIPDGMGHSEKEQDRMFDAAREAAARAFGVE